MTTRSASDASTAGSNPACSSRLAIRSESWKFIWQPNVSIRYLRATTSLHLTFRFRGFAFAFRLGFAFRPRGGPTTEQLFRRRSQAGGHRTAEHAPDFLDAPRPIEP